MISSTCKSCFRHSFPTRPGRYPRSQTLLQSRIRHVCNSRPLPRSISKNRFPVTSTLPALNCPRSSSLASHIPSTLSSPTPPSPPAYSPPKTGLISHLPAPLVPYAELIRLDKPAGTYYLFLPCLFSTLLLSLPAPLPSITQVVNTTLLFGTGAFIMRSAGCTINDLWDRNLDPLVTRTWHRPIARKAISPAAGTAFFVAQCLAGFGLLVQLPPSCLAWGIPSLLLVATYPLAKRVTHYPQVILGLTFSWGAVMGGPALGWESVVSTGQGLAAGALYASCAAWTVLYDMVYAHMDLKDDRGAGIKSIAVKHAERTKVILAGLATVQMGLLGVAGAAVGAGWPFWIGSVGGGAVTLGLLIKRVRLESVKSCWWWFANGCFLTGGAIAAGLAGEYGRRMTEAKEKGDERRRDVPESAWRWMLTMWKARRALSEA